MWNWACWKLYKCPAKECVDIGKYLNYLAPSLKLATAKPLNCKWWNITCKFYFDNLLCQQNFLVLHIISKVDLREKSMQGNFKLDHNKSRIKQRNMIFVPVITVHFITRWFSSWIQLSLSSVARVVVPGSLGLLAMWGPNAEPSRPGVRLAQLSYMDFEPHFWCVHVSSVSCLTGEALSLYDFPVSP